MGALVLYAHGNSHLDQVQGRLGYLLEVELDIVLQHDRSGRSDKAILLRVEIEAGRSVGTGEKVGKIVVEVWRGFGLCEHLEYWLATEERPGKWEQAGDILIPAQPSSAKTCQIHSKSP